MYAYHAGLKKWISMLMLFIHAIIVRVNDVIFGILQNQNWQKQNMR